MGLWDFFRQKKSEEQVPVSEFSVEEKETSQWQEVPAYIETDSKNYERVSVIASNKRIVNLL